MIGKGKTALVVDAAEAPRQMLGAALRALRFERIIPVETIGEARQLLGAEMLDLALIDWHVGDLSGFDLAADIRTGRVPARRDLPIVMMSWNTEPRTALAVQGLKLNGLVTRPVSGGELEKRIAAALVPSMRSGPRRLLGQAS
jgi:DNA-binding response OmpR family regulator